MAWYNPLSWFGKPKPVVQPVLPPVATTPPVVSIPLRPDEYDTEILEPVEVAEPVPSTPAPEPVALEAKPVPIPAAAVPEPVPEPIAPELVVTSDVKLNPAVDAALSLILLLDHELGETPIPDDLRKISDYIHGKLPLSIRDDDAPTTRAEFALTIQRGALYLRAMKDWYDAP